MKARKLSQREHSWIEWETQGEEAELTLYTDGASKNQGAGYGFAAFESNRLCQSEKGPLGRIFPYEVELYAVRAALNWPVSNPQRLHKRQCNLVHRFKVSRTGVN